LPGVTRGGPRRRAARRRHRESARANHNSTSDCQLAAGRASQHHRRSSAAGSARATREERAGSLNPPATSGPASAILTFLIADVRGYTGYTRSAGDEAAARLAASFAEIVREGVEAFGGEVI